MFNMYSFLCIILPCIMLQVVYIKKKSLSNNFYRNIHLLKVNCLIIYLYTVLCVTGIGCLWDIGKYDTIIRSDEINVVPLQTPFSVTNFLNVILFMPLGFFLPFIWERHRSFWKTLSMGMLFSCCIEICQLFNHRTTDIDDFLMNTFGAGFGYCAWWLLKKIFKTFDCDCIELSYSESYMYLIVTVVSEFLLYNWRLFS